eukprot:284817231_5
MILSNFPSIKRRKPNTEKLILRTQPFGFTFFISSHRRRFSWTELVRAALSMPSIRARMTSVGVASTNFPERLLRKRREGSQGGKCYRAERKKSRNKKHLAESASRNKTLKLNNRRYGKSSTRRYPIADLQQSFRIPVFLTGLCHQTRRNARRTSPTADNPLYSIQNPTLFIILMPAGDSPNQEATIVIFSVVRICRLSMTNMQISGGFWRKSCDDQSMHRIGQFAYGKAVTRAHVLQINKRFNRTPDLPSYAFAFFSPATGAGTCGRVPRWTVILPHPTGQMSQQSSSLPLGQWGLRHGEKTSAARPKVPLKERRTMKWLLYSLHQRFPSLPHKLDNIRYDGLPGIASSVAGLYSHTRPKAAYRAMSAREVPTTKVRSFSLDSKNVNCCRGLTALLAVLSTSTAPAMSTHSSISALKCCESPAKYVLGHAIRSAWQGGSARQIVRARVKSSAAIAGPVFKVGCPTSFASEIILNCDPLSSQYLKKAAQISEATGAAEGLTNDAETALLRADDIEMPISGFRLLNLLKGAGTNSHAVRVLKRGRILASNPRSRKRPAIYSLKIASNLSFGIGGSQIAEKTFFIRIIFGVLTYRWLSHQSLWILQRDSFDRFGKTLFLIGSSLSVSHLCLLRRFPFPAEAIARAYVGDFFLLRHAQFRLWTLTGVHVEQALLSFIFRSADSAASLRLMAAFFFSKSSLFTCCRVCTDVNISNHYLRSPCA